MDSPTNVFSRTHPSFRTSCERQSPISKKEQNIPGFRNSLGQEELFSQELNFNKLPRNTKKSFPIEEPKMRKKVRCSYHPEGCFKDSFESFIINLSPQIKIECFCIIIKKYKQLTKRYGFFLLTNQHIKFNESGQVSIWINTNFWIQKPNWPLPRTKQGQAAAIAGLLQLMREHLSDRVHKSAKANSFEQLISYLQKMQKRSSIHKKCQNIALKRQESKKKSYAFEIDYCQSPKFNEGTPKIRRYASSQILKIQLSQPAERMSIAQKSQIEGKSNQYLLPTSESITNFSTHNISKRGSTCVDSSFTKQKKSCTIEQANKENYFSRFPVDKSIQISSKAQNQESESQINMTLNLDLLRENRRNHLKAKSSLEVSFNKLFLSDINEDPQSDMQTSIKTQSMQQELLKQFSSVFY